MYQLCQRKFTSVLQQTHIQIGTTRVRQRENPMAKHCVQCKRNSIRINCHTQGRILPPIKAIKKKEIICLKVNSLS